MIRAPSSFWLKYWISSMSTATALCRSWPPPLRPRTDWEGRSQDRRCPPSPVRDRCRARAHVGVAELEPAEEAAEDAQVRASPCLRPRRHGPDHTGGSAGTGRAGVRAACPRAPRSRSSGTRPLLLALDLVEQDRLSHPAETSQQQAFFRRFVLIRPRRMRACSRIGSRPTSSGEASQRPERTVFDRIHL